MNQYVGKIVMIEHPHFNDAYLVAKVLAETPKKVRLLHFIGRTESWDDELRLRDKGCIYRVLADSEEETALPLIGSFVRQLRACDSARDDSISNAKNMWRANMKAISL